MATANAVDQINLSDSMLQNSSPTSQPKQPGRFAMVVGKAAGIASNVFFPGAGGIFTDMLR
ncbi:MAG TPA: hypothetical protein VH477_15100, partial [Bryobacteraceae bacterium]